MYYYFKKTPTPYIKQITTTKKALLDTVILTHGEQT